jgi:hypothetical protein
VFPHDVANHCGESSEGLKIFLLQKFVVHMPASFSQANVHDLQSRHHGGITRYVIISRHGVYYRYILRSVGVIYL